MVRPKNWALGNTLWSDRSIPDRGAVDRKKVVCWPTPGDVSLVMTLGGWVRRLLMNSLDSLAATSGMDPLPGNGRLTVGRRAKGPRVTVRRGRNSDLATTELSGRVTGLSFFRPPTRLLYRLFRQLIAEKLYRQLARCGLPDLGDLRQPFGKPAGSCECSSGHAHLLSVLRSYRTALESSGVGIRGRKAWPWHPPTHLWSHLDQGVSWGCRGSL